MASAALRSEPVDLRGRRQLANALDKEVAHARGTLRAAVADAEAAVADLREAGCGLDAAAARAREAHRARVDRVCALEAEAAYAAAAAAELDRLDSDGARRVGPPPPYRATPGPARGGAVVHPPPGPTRAKAAADAVPLAGDGRGSWWAS